MLRKKKVWMWNVLLGVQVEENTLSGIPDLEEESISYLEFPGLYVYLITDCLGCNFLFVLNFLLRWLWSYHTQDFFMWEIK